MGSEMCIRDSLGALQRRPQPVGMVVLVRQLATLDAGVALEERIVPVPVDLDHPAAILNVDKDRARGVTYPAERRTCLDHGSSPLNRTNQRVSLFQPRAVASTSTGQEPAPPNEPPMESPKP